MADVHGTNYGEHFGRNSLKLYFQTAISPKITNKKWQGQVKGGRGDRVNIITYGINQWEAYDGTDITFHDIDEVEGQLVLDQKRNNSFKIMDWNRFKAYATDIESTELSSIAELLKQEVDAFNLAFVLQAGSRVGTEVKATAFAVTAAGVFSGASGLKVPTATDPGSVGVPVTISGVKGVFQIATVTSATAGTLADMDDLSTYSGGVVTATDAVLEVNVAIAVTKDNIDDLILAAKEKLDRKGLNGDYCPRKGRFLVVPSRIESILLKSDQLTPYTPSAYEDVTKLGIIGMYRGFKVYVSEEVLGDSAEGFHCLAGHEAGITHAFVPIVSGETLRLENNYGKGLKQLIVYGSKVLEARRKMLCDIFVK